VPYQPDPGEVEARQRHAGEAERRGITIVELTVERALLARAEGLGGRERGDCFAALSGRGDDIVSYVAGWRASEISDTVEHVDALELERAYVVELLGDGQLLTDFIAGDEAVFVELRKRIAAPPALIAAPVLVRDDHGR
jgi:hypothetical protein